MKIVKIWLCAFLFTIVFISLSFAQKIIHVESSETHAPLPYATIVNYTKHLLLFTDKEGNANNNFANGDSVSISYVGYDNLNVVFNLSKSNPYTLKQKKEFLATVQVKTCTKRKDFEYNNLEKDKDQNIFGGLTWNLPLNNSNPKVALMITTPFKDAYIKGFSFWLLNHWQAPKMAIKAPIKFSFFEIIDSTSLPGELISDHQIIYFPKKEGKQTISLDSIHLRIPENGMYICIEYIIDDKYKYPIRIFDKDKGIDSIAIGYGGRFDGVVSKQFRLAFSNYFNEYWYYAKNRSKFEMDIPHGTLKYSVEINYCDEDKINGKK